MTSARLLIVCAASVLGPVVNWVVAPRSARHRPAVRRDGADGRSDGHTQACSQRSDVAANRFRGLPTGRRGVGPTPYPPQPQPSCPQVLSHDDGPRRRKHTVDGPCMTDPEGRTGVWPFGRIRKDRTGRRGSTERSDLRLRCTCKRTWMYSNYCSSISAYLSMVEIETHIIEFAAKLGSWGDETQDRVSSEAGRLASTGFGHLYGPSR